MKPIKYHADYFKDSRGYLLGLIPHKVKIKFNYSIITESKKNVIRGMHYNKKMNEDKLVYILNGKIFDVTINLNKGKNYGKIFYFNLKKDDILYIPKGFAHGYSTLSDDAVIVYLQSGNYSEKQDGSINPLSIDIDWEVDTPILSEKDRNSLDFHEFKTFFE